MGFSLSGLLFFGTAWAHTRPTCEIPLIGKFTGLIDLGLDRGWLPEENLTLTANSDVPVNPLAGVTLDPAQYALYQGFQSLMPEARAHWDQIRDELRARARTEDENRERSETAAEKTRAIVRPQLLSQINVTNKFKKLEWRIKDGQPVLLLDTGRRARQGKPDPSGVFSILEVAEKNADIEALNTAVKKWREDKKEAPQDTLFLQIFEQGQGKDLTKIIVRTSTSMPPMSTKGMMEMRRGGGFSNPFGMVMNAHDMICLRESVEIFSQRQGVLRREAHYDVGNACDAATSQCLIRKNGNLACVIATGGHATYVERASDGTWSERSFIDGSSVFNRIALHETASGEVMLAVSRTDGVSVYRPEQSREPIRFYDQSAHLLSWFERQGQTYLAAFVSEKSKKSYIAEPLISDHRYFIEAFPTSHSRTQPATLTFPDGRVLLAYHGYSSQAKDQIFVLDLFTSMN